MREVLFATLWSTELRYKTLQKRFYIDRLWFGIDLTILIQLISSNEAALSTSTYLFLFTSMLLIRWTLKEITQHSASVSSISKVYSYQDPVTYCWLSIWYFYVPATCRGKPSQNKQEICSIELYNGAKIYSKFLLTWFLSSGIWYYAIR
jgi:hypothetical protein